MLWLTNVGQEKGIGDSVATDGGEKKVGCFNKLAFRRWNRKTDKSFLRSEGEGIPSYFRRPSHKQFCNNDDDSYNMCDPLNCLPQVELLAPQVENLDLFEYIRRILFGHPGRKKVTDLILDCRRERREVSCVSLSAASAL